MDLESTAAPSQLMCLSPDIDRLIEFVLNAGECREEPGRSRTCRTTFTNASRVIPALIYRARLPWMGKASA